MCMLQNKGRLSVGTQSGNACSGDAHPIDVTQQEDALQCLDAQRLQLARGELHQRLCWVHNRLHSVVEYVWDRLLLLGG